MKKRVLPSPQGGVPNRDSALYQLRDCIPITHLRQYADGWLLDNEIEQHSVNTIALRRIITDKLIWFCTQQEFANCGTAELRLFFLHLTNGHLRPGGRWGDAGGDVCRLTLRKASPGTVQTYHRHIRTFFRWMTNEGALDVSPLESRPGHPSIPIPENRPDQIQPFTEQQAIALRAATEQTANSPRDLAILLLFLDTGIRASELCGLTIGDLDMLNWCIRVEGKGGKKRMLRFGRDTKRAIYKYLLQNKAPTRHEMEAPLFMADRTHRVGMALTRSGLQDLFGRLENIAGLTAVRCSPHTCRHTYAVNFLRAGGNVFALQEILGHTDIKQTQRYVRFVEADIENQGRRFSPVDRMKKR